MSEEAAPYCEPTPTERTWAQQYPLSYALAYLTLRNGNGILQGVKEHLLNFEASNAALAMRADSADWTAEALAVENRVLLGAIDALTARAMKAEESVLRLKVEPAEQEVDKLDLIVERVNQRAELTRLKEAIRTASSTKTAGNEIVACAQSATGVDVFRAGQTIGRASLAQDLLNLFDL